MKRKIIGIAIVSLILLGGYVSIAQQIHLIDRAQDKGKFTAEIGIGKDKVPDILLEGTYKMRSRIWLVIWTF